MLFHSLPFCQKFFQEVSFKQLRPLRIPFISGHVFNSPSPKHLLPEMNVRVFVLIFFFWALLSIITPTLVLWSASAKPSFPSLDEREIDLKVREMLMGFLEERYLRRALRPPRYAAEAPSPAPAEAPSPDTGL